MTRKLEEIEAELMLVERERKALDKLRENGLSPQARNLLLEQLSSLREEMVGLAKQGAAPSSAPVLIDVTKFTKDQAAERAAEIRKDPRYWDPRKAVEGKQLSDEQHAELVATHSALLERAVAKEPQ